MEKHILQVEELAEEGDDPVDPVTLLWRTFRRGDSLLAIYNALRPDVPLDATETRQDKREKQATFRFLDACIKELKFPGADVFMITDLYGEDTAGFVKVGHITFGFLPIKLIQS